uniref:Frizzled-2 n=1 Tax=Sipha flava TaxID=143950 RepID=A0A2S2QR95_9HEMI
MVLIPRTIYLVAGVAFWTVGFVSLFRIRNVMGRDGARGADGLEMYMVRIGIVNVLYVVPAAVHILCLVYEHVNVGTWTACRHSNHAPECPSTEIHGPGASPNLEVFIAKYIVSLQVGVTSCVWTCSGKTLNNWQRLLARVPRNPVESETRV